MSELTHFLRRCLMMGILILLIWSPAIIFNFLIDPYHIFHQQASFVSALPNERIVKVRHLLDHPTMYNGLIFGNSRVGTINVNSISNDHYYNFSINGSVPVEYVENLRFLLSHGVQIKHVILGIDDFAMNDPEPASNTRFPFNGNWLDIYARYAFMIPDASTLRYVFYPKEHITYDNATTGQTVWTDREQQIEDHPKEHVDSFYETLPLVTRYNQAQIERALETIHELKIECDQHGIELKIFINPGYYGRFQHIDRNAYLTLLAGLVNISPYFDFSGQNEYTTNAMNYYEFSHYRPSLSDVMIHFMWPQANGAFKQDEGFGVFVTSENIQHHIETIRKQILD